MTTFLRFKVLIVFCFLFSAQSYANVNTYHSFSYYFTTALQKVLTHYFYSEVENNAEYLVNKDNKSAIALTITCIPITRTLDKNGLVTISYNDLVTINSSDGTTSISVTVTNDNDNNQTFTVTDSDFNLDCNFLGSNTVEIEVTDNDGTNTSMETCTATITIEEYTPTTTVSIISSGTDFDICTGEDVEFVATLANEIPGDSFTYNWYRYDNSDISHLLTNSNGNSATLNTTAIQDGDKVYLELISNLSSCTPAVTSNQSATFTVNPILNVSYAINSNDSDNTICLGEEISFNITNVQNGGTPSLRTYQWYFNDVPVSGPQNSSYNFTSLTESGTVKLKMTTSSACDNQLEFSNEIYVTVLALPELTPLTDLTTSPQICVNVTNNTFIQYRISGSATDAEISGLPSGMDILSVTEDTSTSPSTYIVTIGGTPTETGIFNYTVSTTDSDCTEASTNGVLEVLEEATLILKSGSNPTTQEQCENVAINPITFTIGGTATGIDTSEFPPYFILDSSVISPDYTIISDPDNLPPPGSYSFNVIPIGVCNSNALNYQQSVNITIINNLEPEVDIAISNPSQSMPFCEGTSVTFTATPKNGGTPTFNWIIKDSTGSPISIANNDSNPAKFTTKDLPDGAKVSVEMTSSETCVTTTTATSNEIEVNIMDKITPEVSISTSTEEDGVLDNIICDGQQIEFTASYSYLNNSTENPGSEPTYQWKINGSNVGVNSNTFSSNTLNDNDVISVEIKSPDSCITIPIATSNEIIVTVNPNLTPKVNISISEEDGVNDFNICNTANVTFTANYEYENSTAEYPGSTPEFAWTISGSSTVVSTNQVYSGPLTDGQSVSVTITSSDACVTSSTAIATTENFNVFSPLSLPVISGNTAICFPDSGIKYSVPEDDNVLNYNWEVPSGFQIISGQNSNEIEISTTSSITAGLKNIRVTALNPCGEIISENFEISVGSFAYVDAGPDQYVCLGTTSVFLDGDINGVITGPKYFEWSTTAADVEVPNGNGAGNTDAILKGEVTIPGDLPAGSEIIITINATGKISPDCPGTQEDSMTIHILDNPTANFTVAGGPDIDVCTGQDAPLVTITGTANTTVNYQKTVGTAAAVDLSVNIDNTGSATLPSETNLTENITYTLVSVEYTDTPTCIQSLSEQITINILPDAILNNPTNNLNQEVCENSPIENIEITVDNATGMSISGLPTGINITPAFNPNIKTYTISGTADANITGDIKYTLTATGTCESDDI
ncbi:hypothetical protein, partial [Formosa sp. S-31]|uniref:hypothetical protein n=1 Tax=Formosa sp. S-31 TaxID=2790949 RepID=UPI003EB6B9C2